MTDLKTTLTIEAQAKGFEKTTADAKKLTGALDAKAVNEGFKGIEKNLGAVGTLLGQLVAGMKKFNDEARSSKGGDAFKGMADDIKSMTTAMEKFTRAKKESRDEDERHAQKRGFGMGLMQGSGVGEYFPERGLMGNLAGRMVGRTMAGAVGTVAGGMFSGVGGFASGIASLPGGGVVAGQIQNAMAAAEQALAYNKLATGLFQYGYRPGGGGGGGGSAAAARAATAISPATSDAATFTIENDDRLDVKVAKIAANTASVVGVKLFEAAADPKTNPFVRGGAALALGPALGVAALMQKGPVVGATENVAGLEARVSELAPGARLGVSGLKDYLTAKGALEDAKEDLENITAADTVADAGTKPKKEGKRSLLSRINTEGVRFGMDQNATAQMLMQALSVSGGGMEQFNEMSFAQMAGLQLRGVGAETTGALMRAGRLGASTRGGNITERAFEAAQGLGLEGADLATYMRQMAGVLNRFEQTGMPVDDESVEGMATKLAASVGGQRGAAISQGMLGLGQQIATRGPQNAAQFVAMKQLFGYKGGGAGDFLQAMKNAESGHFTGGINNLTASIRGSKAGTAEKVLAVHQLFQQLGIPIGLGEAEQFASGTVNPALEADIQKRLAGKMGLDVNAKDMASRAAAGGVVGAAGMVNARIGAGQTVLPAMQALEHAQNNALQATTNFSGIINAASLAIEHLSETMPEFAQQTVDLLDMISKEVGIR